MADNRPLSENEADDRLKAALNALGEAPGITVAADTALAAARRALWLISLGLIAASSSPRHVTQTCFPDNSWRSSRKSPK